MKIVGTLLFTGALLTAPLQCSSDPDPNRRLEDTPAEALWDLSEEFREAGDEDARRRTLETIVREYPGAREAQRAQLILDGREDEAAESDDSAGSDDSADSGDTAGDDAAEENAAESSSDDG